MPRPDLARACGTSRTSQRERQAKVIAEYERKIAEENERRAVKEDEVRAMEKQELQLIEALKKVQVIQREAFQELESALAGEAPRGLGRRSSSRPSVGRMSARSSSSRTRKKRTAKRGFNGSSRGSVAAPA